MNIKNRIQARFYTIRKRKGLTQFQLAEILDRTEDAISAIERGVSLPSFDTLIRMCEKLEVDIVEFFLVEEADTDPKRAKLLLKIMDTCKSLDNKKLAVASKQFEALAELNDAKNI